MAMMAYYFYFCWGSLANPSYHMLRTLDMSLSSADLACQTGNNLLALWDSSYDFCGIYVNLLGYTDFFGRFLKLVCPYPKIPSSRVVESPESLLKPGGHCSACDWEGRVATMRRIVLGVISKWKSSTNEFCVIS